MDDLSDLVIFALLFELLELVAGGGGGRDATEVATAMIGAPFSSNASPAADIGTAVATA